uniref:4-hydroxy-3-methylbut-2-enyl diphosphate reductase n=1 Tax=Pseudo-nitzschia australis TaxID=44445 RepID=A0A7S4AT90_9STRA|mmetsp:Transcript_1526/g.3370  ORF Transcript_1526/g.3370 Transcript_1526/m.3370 type:complete len:468 (+) Transcript_1526:312-1715(+)|eukprot:CAMPEP_0168173616 /NCGR_PEP_ID=MMETSP0139_2-20121125/6005_1 /TAXON_ID=44445 /ORGANISM="Pseudo-nitzschia australis, Strain 10249 10 AB" /LENGTH=467 /DNA_ID=CAMNT_0008091591 /DNA_START=316 /DNA_END=1719 /DNA_ORIENTATION=+
MKFSSATLSAVLFLGSYANTCNAFSPAITSSQSRTIATSTTTALGATMSKKKEERLEFMKNPQFHRRGFKDVRGKVEETMENEYKADLVEDLKSNNYLLEKDGVKMYLAKDFGFCWGVERSIALAYEAVEHYPDRTLHITNELIHNPEVNDSLSAMKVNLIDKESSTGVKDFSTVEEGDVVILPAFGASYEEMDLFDKKNVEVVDTTCPWVSKVWNAVDKHQKGGSTSVIHGKYAHEETLATVSFCDDYICVKDMKEAEMVIAYMEKGADNTAEDKEAFMKHFEKAVSEGFDPDTMLDKIGLANQTTMYKKETKAIGQLFQKSIMKIHGPAEVDQHYMEFDTICDATQERQDAVAELVHSASGLGLDFILVVGGWDSSNTAHLLEIPHHAGVRSFHINRADCIGADNTITHRTVEGEIVTEKFLTTLDDDKDVVLGVTSGASTPDGSVQDALSQIFLLKQMATNKEE